MSESFQQFKQNTNRWVPDKNKIKFFLVFVLISASFWLLTRFSNVYTSQLQFAYNYTNLPTGVIINQSSIAPVNLWVRATGFQLLWYNLWGKTLELDMQNVELDATDGRLALIPLRNDLERQLFENAEITRIQPSTFMFSFDRLTEKKIPVRLNDAVAFQTGYQYRNTPKLTPDSVVVFGASDALQELEYLSTNVFQKKKVKNDIDENIDLVVPTSIDQLSHYAVRIQASVDKYTELTYELPISVNNLPDSTTIKLFPQKISLRVLVPVNQIDSISNANFEFMVDFAESLSAQKESLDVTLKKRPDFTKTIRWEPQQVEYLIRK